MSASPSPYNPQYNFTNFQTSNPNTPLPAAQVDNEFANISTSNNQIINRLALIQNSDGTLGANCVSPQSLSADVLLLLASSSWPYLGAWVTGHAYVISNVVTQSSINYICVVAHTSGTFATDLANGDWVALTQASSTVTYPTGSIIANFSGSTMAPSAYTPIQIRNQIDLASVNVASASTTSIGGASSNSVTITGTTTITGFDIVAAGIIRYVTFSGSLTLTYNSTSLQLPGVANITTQAGDSAIFESLGSGNWKAISWRL